jgi:hypothetical protein
VEVGKLKNISDALLRGRTRILLDGLISGKREKEY